MARSRRGSTFFAPMRKKTRFERFKEFLWNPETNQFLGRNGTGWALILIFYCCLYACLAGFFSIMMLGLNASLDEHFPKYTLDNSPIGTTPGLSLRPRSDSMDLSIISFRPSDQSTWQKIVNQLNAELEPYKEAEKLDLIDCDNVDKPYQNNMCRFNIVRNLGAKCVEDNDFGYRTGEPCILFKLNKIIGWTPEPFDDTSKEALDYTLQRNYFDELDPHHIGITCYSANPSEKDHIGDVNFYPRDGFNTKYFPYMNQKGYLSPLVMVKFKNLKRDVIINVECKIWAKNIEQNRQKKRGFIRFELMVQEEE